MRTTLNIDDPVLEEIRQIQREEGGSIGKIVSILLADAVAARRNRTENAPFRWHVEPMRSKLDLRDQDAVYDLMDTDTRS